MTSPKVETPPPCLLCSQSLRNRRWSRTAGPWGRKRRCADGDAAESDAAGVLALLKDSPCLKTSRDKRARGRFYINGRRLHAIPTQKQKTVAARAFRFNQSGRACLSPRVAGSGGWRVWTPFARLASRLLHVLPQGGCRNVGGGSRRRGHNSPSHK